MSRRRLKVRPLVAALAIVVGQTTGDKEFDARIVQRHATQVEPDRRAAMLAKAQSKRQRKGLSRLKEIALDVIRNGAA